MASLQLDSEAAVDFPAAAPEIEQPIALKESVPVNKTAYTVMGLIVLGMICMIPLWNAGMMLDDPALNHFFGSTIPNLIIAVSVVAMFVHVFSMTLFFKYVPKEYQNDVTLLMGSNMVLLLLGAVFLILSIPLTSNSVSLSSNIFNSCSVTKGMDSLYTTGNTLNQLRETPACAAERTIETCAGFEKTPESNLLKEIENKYMCSGVCFGANNVPVAEMPTSIAAKLLTSKAITKRTFHKSGRRSMLEVFRADEPNSVAGPQLPFPPTLFSKANFQVTCDGMIARNVKDVGTDVANQLFYQGIFLVFISVVVSLMKLFGSCLGEMISPIGLVHKKNRKHGGIV